MGNQIHWFPGHMNKALKEMEERISTVDVCIELLDSRAPYSSICKPLEKLIGNKKKLVILSKPDLADPKITEQFKEKLSANYDLILVLDLTNPSSEKAISKAVTELGKDKWAKQKARGMKPQPIKTMILGIPNVGKSSLINRLAKRKAAGVQNKPGYTRGEQWIKVNNDFILLDTPGVLPMNYEDKASSCNLALLGSIREEILPIHDLVDELLKRLRKLYPDGLKERFGIETIEDTETVLNQICDVRKLVTNNGEKDLQRASLLLLKEFKDGSLGRMTIERP